MMTERLGRQLAALWLVVTLGLAAYDVRVWVIDQRTPETDILALLPAGERDAAVDKAMAQVAEVAQRYLVVLVSSRDWETARAAAAAYRAVLASKPEWFEPTHVSDVDAVTALAPWWERRHSLLTPADRAALRADSASRWTDVALRGAMSPLGTGRFGTWQDDPFGIFQHWIQAHGSESPVRPVDGVLRVDDGQIHYVVMPVRLRSSAFSFAAQREVLPVHEAAVAAARAVASDVKVLSAGLILPAAAAAIQADHEMSTIGWGSIIGIILLAGIALKSPRPIGLVLVSLLVGAIVAMATTAWMYPKVHLITLIFGASLLGVAADYGLNFVCTRGDTIGERWDKLRVLLPGLAFAVLTTVIAFLGLALLPFPGLRQMAVFSVSGLFGSWISAVVWFPLLQAKTPEPSGAARWFGATRARWPLVRSAPRWWIAAAIVGLAVTVGLYRLRADDDIRLLQNTSPEMIAEQTEVGRILASTSMVQFYIVRGPTEAAVLEREEVLAHRLDSLVGTGAITGYHAVSRWVPSPTQQQADATLIHDRLLAAAGPLDALAAVLGEDRAWAAARRAGRDQPVLRVADWLRSPISEPMRQLWLGDVGGEVASVVALQGLEYSQIDKLRGAATLPGVRWVDKVADISSELGRFRVIMSWVIGLSYILVFCIHWPRYGRRTWRTLAPSVLASLVAVATLGLIGKPVQLFHVLALLLVFGSGVDYAIFLIERPSRLEGDAWVGVGLAAMNTILSFGLLALSATPVLEAFGFTMLVGITVSLLAAPAFCTDWSAPLNSDRAADQA